MSKVIKIGVRILLCIVLILASVVFLAIIPIGGVICGFVLYFVVVLAMWSGAFSKIKEKGGDL